jgi:hypothetical protein
MEKHCNCSANNEKRPKLRCLKLSEKVNLSVIRQQIWGCGDLTVNIV